MRCAAVPVVLAAAVGLAGCGSVSDAQLPPAATPVASPPLTGAPTGRVASSVAAPAPPQLTATSNDGATRLRLDPRARRLTATGTNAGSVGAGVGPAQLASNGEGTAYVTDTVGDGLVVVRTTPTLAVTRRVSLPDGAPWAVTFDPGRYRLWVTLTATNELVEIQAGSRPRELRRYPTVRFPTAVRVAADGTVVVTGREQQQRLTPTDDDG